MCGQRKRLGLACVPRCDFDVVVALYDVDVEFPAGGRHEDTLVYLELGGGQYLEAWSRDCDTYLLHAFPIKFLQRTRYPRLLACSRRSIEEHVREVVCICLPHHQR